MFPQSPTDSLRAVLDSVFAAPEYQWRSAPRPLGFLQRLWTMLGLWLNRFHDSNPLLFQYFFWGLVLLLVLILTHAGWVFLRTVRGASAREGAVAGGPGVEARDARWYRREANRLATEGRYAEALHALFRALVLDLDARGLVRFHPSKTPNEYTYEPRLELADRERLRELVRGLYAYAFARQPCGPEEYRAWRQRAAEGWHAAAG